mgnify:CR=1 FL=1
MAKKAVYLVVAVAGLALASGAAWWLQNREAPATAAAAPASAARGAGGAGTPGVEVTRVKAVRLQDDAQAVGTLRSRQSVTLKPEVSGRVARIAFADGAQVKAGQLLVQLDDTLQRAELSQAQAQLSIARANLKRNQELVAQNFVATRVVEESQANLQVAEAQVEELERARFLYEHEAVQEEMNSPSRIPHSFPGTSAFTPPTMWDKHSGEWEPYAVFYARRVELRRRLGLP